MALPPRVCKSSLQNPRNVVVSFYPSSPPTLNHRRYHHLRDQTLNVHFQSKIKAPIRVRPRQGFGNLLLSVQALFLPYLLSLCSGPHRPTPRQVPPIRRHRNPHRVPQEGSQDQRRAILVHAHQILRLSRHVRPRHEDLRANGRVGHAQVGNFLQYPVISL